jgi:hypothetical protein
MQRLIQHHLTQSHCCDHSLPLLNSPAPLRCPAAIYRGRVLEEGTNEELMKLNGYYAYLVAASST